jgi:alkanesulfonate monooxygenase SsuD/methylene tetrahydromethanopterin reductase-like flavin-dependent oxidoreductase (luciferase family)
MASSTAPTSPVWSLLSPACKPCSKSKSVEGGQINGYDTPLAHASADAIALAPWVIVLDSRAEMLLRCSLLFCDRVLQLSGKRNPTVRDFMHYTGRGRLENPWVGSPKDIADRWEEWFSERACNGFVVGPTYLPGTF